MANNDNDARLGGSRKKKKPLLPPEETKQEAVNPNVSRFFNLFILVFIGYGFYSYMQKGGDAGILNEIGSQLDVIDAAKNADPRIDPLTPQTRINSLSRMFPVKRSSVTARTLKQGTGEHAFCGQTAQYRLISGFGKNQEVSEPQLLQLGSRSAPYGLTLGLDGMRIGEVRELSIPQELWTGIVPPEGQNSEITKVTLELETLSPSPMKSTMPLRRFIVRGGSDRALRCGETAMLHLTIWNAQGEKLFSSLGDRPVHFTIGAGNMPYGIERGVQDMAAGGLYSLVISPELWKPLSPNDANNQQSESVSNPFDTQPFPANLNIPENEIILVDIDYPLEVARKALPAASTPVSEPIRTN